MHACMRVCMYSPLGKESFVNLHTLDVRLPAIWCVHECMFVWICYLRFESVYHCKSMCVKDYMWFCVCVYVYMHYFATYMSKKPTCQEDSISTHFKVYLFKVCMCTHVKMLRLHVSMLTLQDVYASSQNGYTIACLHSHLSHFRLPGAVTTCMYVFMSVWILCVCVCTCMYLPICVHVCTHDYTYILRLGIPNE
jgi:hypothetical protein